MEKNWNHQLTPDEYDILIEKGTESPFSGKYYKCEDPGVYRCVGCGQNLFSSVDKFDSHSGWPSFTQPYKKGSVEFRQDLELSAPRTEVLCSKCHGHLGHVFDDGPLPTKKRYCINSIILKLEEDIETI